MRAPLPLNRRRFLTTGAAATAGTAFLGGLSSTPAAASPATATTAAPAAATTDQFDQLRTTWSDILTGGPAVDPTDPDFAAAIQQVDATAAAAVAAYDDSSAPTSVYTDLPFTQIENATATYTRLLQTAIAWATPGSHYHQDQSTADRLVSALRLIGTAYFHGDQTEVGNWYHWEIGSPQPLVNTLAILGDQVPAADLASHLATVAYFDPDPTVQQGRTTTTGANRSDKCQITILRGILAKDASLVTLGRDKLSDIFPYVTEGDGYYRDGGYFQHTNIPYNGHYAYVLLNDLSQLARLLTGSDFAITDPQFATTILSSIDLTYAPFMRDGLVMDVARGRFLSRQGETDHDAGHAITEAVLGLIPLGAREQQKRWKSLAKAWITGETYAPILRSATPARVALVKTVLDDPLVSPAPATADHRQLPSIARAVHTRPEWSWTVGLSGRKIARFEAINGENQRGWHTGDGATYLYDADNGHYTDAYWPTVDCRRLPGTTVDSLPLATSAGAQTLPPTAFAGGAALDAALGGYGALGLDLVPYGSPMRARKSWFCLDDCVVALGAGITGGSGHPIETIVENRNLGESGANRLTVDGRPQPTAPGWSAEFTGARWAHLDGVAGYVFPGPRGADLRALREARTGAWSDIDDGPSTGGTTTPYTRRYATLWFDHGTAPDNASYAYLVLPGAGVAKTLATAVANPVEILAATASQQAIRVRSLGLTAVVFFAAGSAAGITVSAPCTVLTRTVRGRTVLAAADATLSLTSLTVTVGRRRPLTVDLTQGLPGATHQLQLTD
ncbi:polysaccharide lyase 8 family protein [Phaeacidiphilus oryzae]|uniref:polysaccharide lyase 8 family protein n=1 Tax=Phaeacidiphilus oryzae TaxID=348818 RepID=UPI000564AEF7|nr:polysaccharide lyase 8 family protein [Phaeacidiphilus oryzae]